MLGESSKMVPRVACMGSELKTYWQLLNGGEKRTQHRICVRSELFKRHMSKTTQKSEVMTYTSDTYIRD